MFQEYMTDNSTQERDGERERIYIMYSINTINILSLSLHMPLTLQGCDIPLPLPGVSQIQEEDKDEKNRASGR